VIFLLTKPKSGVMHSTGTSCCCDNRKTCVVYDSTKLDFDSLIETKNWGGRNEVIETSGRLRPLWPQNKRLHSPRTTDRQHTRQDRWIQKELAFTPAKNATKPNPFKIISLQPARKENNWETEETMERATVTLETERAKWPNPGCLWWWWWFTERCCSS
jgi:hypothetical protein